MDSYTYIFLGTLFWINNCIVPGHSADIVDAFPYYNAEVIAGEDFFFYITENVMNIHNCSFKSEGGDIVLYNDGEIISHNKYRYWKSNSGNCGVWVKAVEKNQSGFWSLIAQNSSGAYTGFLQVNIIDKVIPENKETVMILGDSAVINLGPPEVVYCKVQHPSGLDLGIKYEKCRHYLQFVRTIDAGIWTAYYTVQGSTEEFPAYSTYTIEGISESSVVGRVSKSLTEKNALNIMCILTNSQVSFKYCIFERPDGAGFLYNDGVGKGRYRSYKFGSRSDITCGLTIIDPADEDFGFWKCEMYLNSQVKSRDGTFIYIKKSENDKFPSMKLSSLQTEIVGVAGSELILGCYIRYSLSSCWFRHPKGKIFNVEPGVDYKDFKYSGYSLGLGQCSIKLKNVTTDDVGEWWCNTALNNQSLKDLSVPIAVYIEDQEMFAPLPEVKSYISGSAILQCHSTYSDQPLSYCRFISPRGEGFTLNNNYSLHGKYTYAGKGLDVGDCVLKISPVEEDDFGTWICSASLLKNRTREAQAHIKLKQSETFGSSAAVITVATVVPSVVMVAIIFVFIRLRNRRRRFTNVSSSS